MTIQYIANIKKNKRNKEKFGNQLATYNVTRSKTIVPTSQLLYEPNIIFASINVLCIVPQNAIRRKRISTKYTAGDIT